VARKKNQLAEGAEESLNEILPVENVGDNSEEVRVKKSWFRSKSKDSENPNKSSLAPASLILAFAMLAALVFSFFYRPVATDIVSPKVNNGLRIFLSITTDEFATEGSQSGSLEVCKGTKKFPNIGEATVHISDTNKKEIGKISVVEAASKTENTCLYEIQLDPVPNFSGTKLNLFVRFSFGDSSTFLVDVGSEPPFKKVNIRLTLS
jgi:hypothetical protein